MALAAALRAGGLRVLVYPDADKIGKQIKYADGRGIPFVALLGDDEIRAAATVTVKDMAAQAQQTYPQARRPARHIQTGTGKAPWLSSWAIVTRTHTCGALRPEDVGADVVLLGWVHRVRDLGGLLFVDVRDRAGVTQVVFDKDDEALWQAEAPELESRHLCDGTSPSRARRRTMNPKLPPARSKSWSRGWTLLTRPKTPPFPIAGDADDVGGRAAPATAISICAAAAAAGQHRAAFESSPASAAGCTDERVLGRRDADPDKSTPEGARDYLVPSRVHPGKFYALPQSPQLFKQILMISGVDRYVQICAVLPRRGCARRRAAGEFTQVDVEMSFARPETCCGDRAADDGRSFARSRTARSTRRRFSGCRTTEAMARYGTDKPDLRNPDAEPSTSARLFRESGFRCSRKAVAAGGIVRASSSRRESRSKSRSFFDKVVELGAVAGAGRRRLPRAGGAGEGAAGEVPVGRESARELVGGHRRASQATRYSSSSEQAGNGCDLAVEGLRSHLGRSWIC